MNIGSTAGTSLSQLLSQLKASTAAGSSTTSSATNQVATSSASTTTSVAENSDFFLNQLSASIMESLLSGQSQASQTSQSSLMSDTSQTSLTSHAHKHGGHHKPPSLQDMDSDGDGSLSKTEMEGYSQSTTGDSTTSKADALFSKMDTNGDGSVSAAEKSAFDQQMAANRPDGPPPGDAQGQPSTDGTSQTLSSIGTGAGSTDLASLMHELLSALQSYSASQGTTTSAASSTLSIAA